MGSTFPAIEVQGYEASGHLIHAIIFNRGRYWICAISQAGGMQAAIPAIKMVKTSDRALLYRKAGRQEMSAPEGRPGSAWGPIGLTGELKTWVIFPATLLKFPPSMWVPLRAKDMAVGKAERAALCISPRDGSAVGRGDNLSVSLSTRRHISTLPAKPSTNLGRLRNCSLEFKARDSNIGREPIANARGILCYLHCIYITLL
jgi:hypothetical protein